MRETADNDAHRTDTVLVGVENPVQRAGLLATLAGTEGIRPVGHADTIDEVREKVAELSPNVLLLDVAFRRSDESLIPELAEAHPGTRTLVLVDHSDDQCALRYFLAEKGRVTLSPEAVQILDDCCLVSLHASAYGCVSSDSEPDRIVKAIRVVASGRVAAAPWLGYLERAPREGRRGRRKERQPVTARELEVISLVAEGHSNQEVARRLGIREQTVKNHLTRIARKLGVKSRLQLGVEAVNRNLAVRRRPEPAAAVREPPNRDPG
jgi:DNA-binding NarL/FixJ family response regulator